MSLDLKLIFEYCEHLPSYNYLGPGTYLDIRLNKNNIPKPGEEPINAIDQLAYTQVVRISRNLDQPLWESGPTHFAKKYSSLGSA